MCLEKGNSCSGKESVPSTKITLVVTSRREQLEAGKNDWNGSNRAAHFFARVWAGSLVSLIYGFLFKKNKKQNGQLAS